MNRPEGGLVGVIVKWDGDGQIPDDAAEHPEKYPQVSEVVKCGDGLPAPQVTYRRETPCQ